MGFGTTGFGVGGGGGGSGSGTIHATGVSDSSGENATTSTTYADVTDPAAISLVTTKVCTILAFFCVDAYHSAIGGAVFTRLDIDGTAQNEIFTQPPIAGDIQAMSCLGRKTGVAAGTIAIKAQVKVNSGTGTLNRGRIIAVAIQE